MLRAGFSMVSVSSPLNSSGERCQSVQTVKNGKAKNGTQTYLCKVCGRRFHPDAKSVAHSQATRSQILDAVHERMSLRGVQRVLGRTQNGTVLA